LNNHKPLFFSVVFIAILLTTYVIATVLFAKPIPTKGSIYASAGLSVIREDDGGEINEIYWGVLKPQAVVSSDQPTILGTRIVLKNIGNVPLTIAWNTTDLPWYLNLTATQNGYLWNSDDYTAFRIDPTYINGYIIFKLGVDKSAPAENFNFTIWFNGIEAP